MPEFGFGSDMSASGVHVRPSSCDQVWPMRPDLVRTNACSDPSACTRMLGWMASMVSPGGDASGGVAVQVAPPSVERSKCTRHRLRASGASVLLPATMVPSASSTGLSLMGPRMPSGSRRGAVQWTPPSSDVVTMPHHRVGIGPTL